VVYPIVDLNRGRIKVVDFVSGLEQAMIQTAALWGVDAKTDPINRGVWLSGEKLGSIGIAVRRGISFHGLALNVNTDMIPFSWINPCGLDRVRMTSFEQCLDRTVPLVEVRKEMAIHLAMVFQLDLKPLPADAFYKKFIKTPSWKQRGIRLQIEGSDLSSEILQERDSGP
jgi:lipoate-protein ligase B